MIMAVLGNTQEEGKGELELDQMQDQKGQGEGKSAEAPKQRRLSRAPEHISCCCRLVPSPPSTLAEQSASGTYPVTSATADDET